jgi:transposase InsO family protein
MKEPGLDGRHRDKAVPKTGEIQQKRGDTLNKNLPKPIPQFRADTRLDTMRYVHDRSAAQTVLSHLPNWFEDYNQVHPRKALQPKSPREFIRSHLQPAACPVG